MEWVTTELFGELGKGKERMGIEVRGGKGVRVKKMIDIYGQSLES